MTDQPAELAELAAPADPLVPPGGPTMNLLWSYFYARTMQLDTFLEGLEVPRLRFFADSGAHSARTLGVALELDDYAAWIKRWAPWFTIYANLDVIGAPARTLDNQRRLEEVHGLHPMPVYHTGEPPSVLERYIEEGYTYIALGKLLGNPYPRLKPWLERAFKIADGRAVFHGFGLTVWDALRTFPFYSVDSSSWGSGVRFGNLKLFHRGQWVSVQLRTRKDVAKHREVLDAYGLPWRALTREGYRRDLVAGACAVAMYRANEHIRRIHGPIALPPGKGYPPPNLPQKPKVARAADAVHQHTYLAEGSSHGHVWHADGLHLYLADSATRGSKLCNHAAEAIAKEQGPHVFLAEGSNSTKLSRVISSAISEEQTAREGGPHVYLADSEKINHALAAGAITREGGQP